MRLLVAEDRFPRPGERRERQRVGAVPLATRKTSTLASKASLSIEAARAVYSSAP